MGRRLGSSSPGKLCAIQKGSTHCYGEDGSLGDGVGSLYEDSKGNLWAIPKTGIWRWKPGPAQFYPLSDNLSSVKELAQDTDGTILVPLRQGVGRLVDGKIKPYPLPRSIPQFRSRNVFRDRDGGLWVGMDRGVLHMHQGREDIFSAPDGLSGKQVLSIFEDREGNIWIATESGLDRFREFAVATFTTKQGLPTSVSISILASRDGSLWLSTAGGLDRWEGGEVAAYDKRDGKLDGLAPNSLFQDSRGRIWASTLSGLGYLQGGRFIAAAGVPRGLVFAIAEDAADDLWIANQSFGLFRLRQGSVVQGTPWIELRHRDPAMALVADRSRGGLWLGFFLGGVAYFADGRLHKLYTAADGLGTGRVNSLRIDPDGTLWASTEGGLSRLKDGSLVTLNSKNGLPCDSVHWLIKDDDGSFWLYMPCGLVRIARSEMESWAAAVDKNKDWTRKVQSTVFDNSDGVRSLAQIGTITPQVAKSSDGKLWFLPWDGVSMIDPRHIPFNRIPPPVHVEQMIADRTNYEVASDANGRTRLAPHVRDLEIDYTALSLVAPEKNRFRYKLEGFDRDWQDVGNRRQAFYTNLPPAQLPLPRRCLQQQRCVE